MAICVECAYKNDTLDDALRCNNSELPISDFLYGNRFCEDLNGDGRCIGFKPQSQLESIYELKKDEELAKTRSEEDVLSLIDKR